VSRKDDNPIGTLIGFGMIALSIKASKSVFKKLRENFSKKDENDNGKDSEKND
jgi:hypothetical protein